MCIIDEALISSKCVLYTDNFSTYANGITPEVYAVNKNDNPKVPSRVPIPRINSSSVCRRML